MEEYDLIVIGTGSAMNYLQTIMNADSNLKVAVIDKDEPGGICLTRGCIPSKILLYPAELISNIQRALHFGIDANINSIDFSKIMNIMRLKISKDIKSIKSSLESNPRINYIKSTAEFIAPYTIKANSQILKGKMIFICTGSRPSIPSIKGLDTAGYLTSDSVLTISQLPSSIAIIGGGYIAAEYGHFFASMGSKVTIIGHNPLFIPKNEPEISNLAKKIMSRNMQILTNQDIIEIKKSPTTKEILVKNRGTDEGKIIKVSEIIVATGRQSNSDLLKPEKSGIEVDDHGWIKVDEHMQTTQDNIWVMGDAIGKYQFKHVANHESTIVYYNAILKKTATVNYHAVPSAIFSQPEIAQVGLSEKEAVNQYGQNNILVGFERFQDTAKGLAMDLEDEFVKILVEKETNKILGAHIIGPHASILIHEIIPLMYTSDQSALPLMYAMDIHPSLSEIIKRAFYSTIPLNQYHQIMQTLNLI